MRHELGQPLPVDSVLELTQEVNDGGRRALDVLPVILAAKVETEHGSLQPAYPAAGGVMERQGLDPAFQRTWAKPTKESSQILRPVLPGRGLVGRTQGDFRLALHAVAVGNPNFSGERIGHGGFGVNDRDYVAIGGWWQDGPNGLLRRLIDEKFLEELRKADPNELLGYVSLFKNNQVGFEPLVALHEPSGQLISAESHDALANMQVRVGDWLGSLGLGGTLMRHDYREGPPALTLGS